MPRFKIPTGVKIFVAIWLLVLLVPPLRELFFADRLMRGQILDVRADANALSRRFPDDPKVLALSAESPPVDDGATLGQKQILERCLENYDALLKRFPRENWLRAERLMFLARYPVNMDYQGAAKRSTKRYVDAPTLRKALAVTLEGEKLDPGNAFFPWMEAAFHFGLAENDLGVAALQKAARCHRFTDYIKERTNQKLEVYSRDHTLLFEEKLAIYSSILFPHYGQMRNAQKAAVQVALNARRGGNSKRSLEVTDAVLGAASVYGRNTDTFLGTLNASGMVQTTLNEMNQAFGLKEQKSAHSIRERHEQVIALAKDFGEVARRNGRDDLAKRVLTEAQASLPFLHLWEGDWWDDFGLQSPWSRIAFQASTFVALIAFWAFGFGFIWLIGQAAFIWLSRKDGNFKERGTLLRGQVASSTSFTLWATLGFCALAAYCGVGFIFGSVGWIPNLDMATNELINAALTGALPFSAGTLWLLPVPFFMWRRNWVWMRLPKTAPAVPLPVPSRLQLIRRIVWLLTVVVGVITASNGYSLWDGTIFQPLVSPVLAWSFFLGAFSFEIFLALQFQTFSFNRLRPGKFHRERMPHRWLFAARLLVSTAGVLSVVWSFLFLLGSLGVWPLRATMNRTLEHRMAIGEIKWLEEDKARRELHSEKLQGER